MVPLSQPPVSGGAPAPAQTPGQAPAAATQPAPAAPAPESPAPPPPPAAPHPAVAELLKLRSRLEELEQQEAERAATAAALAEQKILEQGKSETVKEYYKAEMAKRDAALAALRERTLSAERARAIATGLSGKQFAYAEAAADLQALWANDFETVDGPDGSFATRCKLSLRPAAEVIAERLASPRYAHFLRAESQGGVSPGGGNAAPTVNPATAAPRTFEESVMAAWQARQQSQAEGPAWQQDYRAQLRRRN